MNCRKSIKTAINIEHSTNQGSISNEQYTSQKVYHIDTTRQNSFYACISSSAQRVEHVHGLKFES